MIRFRNATQRRTACYDLTIGDVGILISYETVIAVTYKGECYRRTNEWGPTTWRHMSEIGLKNWPELSEREFNDKVEQFILRSIKDRVEKRLA